MIDHNIDSATVAMSSTENFVKNTIVAAVIAAAAKNVVIAPNMTEIASSVSASGTVPLDSYSPLPRTP